MFISTEAKYIFVDNLFTFGSMSVLDTMSLLVFKYHFDLLSGQPIDSPVNGPAPLPWNIPAQPQQMFSDFQTKLEVPHTANIKVLTCNSSTDTFKCKPPKINNSVNFHYMYPKIIEQIKCTAFKSTISDLSRQAHTQAFIW